MSGNSNGRDSPGSLSDSDLLDFHHATFGKPFTGPLEAGHPAESNGTIPDTDADLGHYPDGVQRTLTEEQIAIFRHSEIRKLMLERSRKAIQRDASELSEGEIESDGGDAVAPRQAPPGEDVLDVSSTSQLDVDKEDEEREYAEFLKRERLEFIEATQQQRRRQSRRQDDSDRTISTRRKIREMDEQHDSVQTISYDEQDVNPNHPASHGGTPGMQLNPQTGAQGRKIWWPEIGAELETDLYVQA